MLSILIANTKGGCGKTTLATHLAAAFAVAGHRTVLADADRQLSSLDWLARRPAGAAPLTGLDWTRDIGEAPKKTDRLVIDAPAALKIKQVEALLKLADVIVLPVLPSAFDEGATARFLAKLDELKPIRKARKPVAVVGNRLRPRSRAAARLDDFLGGLGHRVVARLRDSALYPDAAAAGLSLFDLQGQRVTGPRADWGPLLRYVEDPD